MLVIWLLSLLDIFILTDLSFASARQSRGEIGGGETVPADYANDWKKGGRACPIVPGKMNQVIQIAKENRIPSWVLQTACRETRLQATCLQPKGQANNPYSAYGICSMWASPKRLHIGARYSECQGNMNGGSPQGIANQLKCCHKVMAANKRYHFPGTNIPKECRHI